MEDESLFNKCQAKHLCSIDILSCSLKNFTLAIIPSLSKTEFILLQGLLTLTNTQVLDLTFGKQTNKLNQKTFWTFDFLPKNISFPYFPQQPECLKILVCIYFLSPYLILSSLQGRLHSLYINDYNELAHQDLVSDLHAAKFYNSFSVSS